MIETIITWLKSPCITEGGFEWLHMSHGGAIVCGIALLFCVVICCSKKMRNLFF